MRECEKGRAQLWSIYFALRGLDDPPEFLRRTETQLHNALAPDHESAPPGDSKHRNPSLKLVRYDGKRPD
jgi:hypothetical protein